MLCSSHWILWPNWQHWCQGLEPTAGSPTDDFTECWHRIAGTVSSITPTRSVKVKKPLLMKRLMEEKSRIRQQPSAKECVVRAAQRLKRVFNIDVSICSACGGPMKIIASIEDPFVIDKILSHLEGRGSQESATRRPGARAPPPAVC